MRFSTYINRYAAERTGGAGYVCVERSYERDQTSLSGGVERLVARHKTAQIETTMGFYRAVSCQLSGVFASLTTPPERVLKGARDADGAAEWVASHGGDEEAQSVAREFVIAGREVVAKYLTPVPGATKRKRGDDDGEGAATAWSLTKDAVKKWVRSPHRAHVDGIIFNPSLRPGRIPLEADVPDPCGGGQTAKRTVYVWNIFSGFGVEVEGRGDSKYTAAYRGSTQEARDRDMIAHWLDTLREMSCGDREADQEACFRFSLMHLAKIFQAPNFKSRVIVIYCGEQGAGKDSTLGAFGALLGDSYANSSDGKGDFLGDFNAQLATCVFAKLEEFDFHDAAGAAKLKSLITATRLMVNEKREKRLGVDSFVNFVCTSNKMMPCIVEVGDRRVVIFRTTSCFAGAQNSDFWTEWHRKTGAPEFLPALARYLYHGVDTSGFLAARDRPTTAVYEYAKLASNRPWHVRFVQRRLEVHRRVPGERRRRRATAT